MTSNWFLVALVVFAAPGASGDSLGWQQLADVPMLLNSEMDLNQALQQAYRFLSFPLVIAIHAIWACTFIMMFWYYSYLYLLFRDAATLSYLAYLANGIIWVMASNGLGLILLWPDNFWLMNFANQLFAYSSLAFSGVFCVHFLQLSRSGSGASQWLYFLVFASLAGCILTFYIDSPSNGQVLSVLAVLHYCSYLVLGINALIKGQDFARYYVLAWFSQCAVILYLAARTLMDDSYISMQVNLLIELASTLQILLIGLSLALWIKSVQQQQKSSVNVSKLKHTFMTRMNHQIRTPLMSILGASQLLTNHLRGTQSLHYNKVIQQAGASLLAISNDIVSRGKNAQFIQEHNPENTNMVQLCEQTLALFQSIAKEKNLELRLDVAKGFPEVILVDASKTKQIIINLINNALKFTDRGKVTLFLNIERQRFLITVQDSGKGIAQDKLGTIFESYHQEELSTARNYGGTGLGLSIVKQLLALMSGSISVQSDITKGSIFSISLPLITGQYENKKTAPTLLTPVLAMPARVLLLEEDVMNRQVVSAMLKQLTAAVTAVGTGQKALQLCQQEVFDLVLTCEEMPDMSALDFIHYQQGGEALENKTPVILVGVDIDDEYNGQAAAFTARLSKPFTLQQLATTLNAVLQEPDLV